MRGRGYHLDLARGRRPESKECRFSAIQSAVDDLETRRIQHRSNQPAVRQTTPLMRSSSYSERAESVAYQCARHVVQTSGNRGFAREVGHVRLKKRGNRVH